MKLIYYEGYEPVEEAITRHVNEMVEGVERKNQK